MLRALESLLALRQLHARARSFTIFSKKMARSSCQAMLIFAAHVAFGAIAGSCPTLWSGGLAQGEGPATMAPVVERDVVSGPGQSGVQPAHHQPSQHHQNSLFYGFRRD